MTNIGTRALSYANDESVIFHGFSKGDVIFRQDDPAHHWFEVMSGMIRTCHLFLDGRRQLTGFFCRGDVFGTDQGTHRTTAEVVTDSATIRRVRWGNPVEDDRGLERALQCAENSILLLGHRTAAERIAAFLLDLQARTDAGPIVTIPMPRLDIADYLSLTIETVSRTFRQLARRGLIRFSDPHRVCIADLHALRILAGHEELQATTPLTGGADR